MGRPRLAFLCATLCLAGLAAGRATSVGELPATGPVDAEPVTPAGQELQDDGPADEPADGAAAERANAPAAAEDSPQGPVGGGGARGGRRLFGRIGFLAGLHLGGAISSSGSLSASHSLNVFGKVMNTALSVSYGSNGLYPGAGLPPAGPPLLPLHDEPAAAEVPSSTANPNKGYETSALLNLKKTQIVTGDGVSNVKVVVETRRKENANTTETEVTLEPGCVNASVIGVGNGMSSSSPSLVKVTSGPSAAMADQGGEEEEEDDVGEEPDPPAVDARRGVVQVTAHKQVGLETRVRVDPGPAARAAAEQHRLFLEHHKKHVAAFNNHLVKYKGDVSRVSVSARA